MSTLEYYDRADPWYLIHCKARKEQYAASMLEKSLDLTVYLPEWKNTIRRKVQILPLFPGYLFVQADLEKVPLSQVNTTPGVLRLVDFGGGPQPVPHHVIEGIAGRLNQIDQIYRPSFQPKDIVRFKNNAPLKDLEMIFVGPMTSSQRVTVLLNFLGRLKEVHVDIASLEKVRTPVSPARS